MQDLMNDMTLVCCMARVYKLTQTIMSRLYQSFLPHGAYPVSYFRGGRGPEAVPSWHARLCGRVARPVPSNRAAYRTAGRHERFHTKASSAAASGGGNCDPRRLHPGRGPTPPPRPTEPANQSCHHPLTRPRRLQHRAPTGAHRPAIASYRLVGTKTAGTPGCSSESGAPSDPCPRSKVKSIRPSESGPFLWACRARVALCVAARAAAGRSACTAPVSRD